MTVQVQETVFTHTGNGITTVFSYGCKVLSSDDLYVFLDGERVTSGFTIDGIGASTGGSIAFSTAPADGIEVRIERKVILKRDTDYAQNGDFRAVAVNPDFDRLWMALQQIEHFVGASYGASGRMLRLGDGDTNGSGAYRALLNRIQDLADPVNQQDATTKSWVQTQIAGFLADGAGQVVLDLLASSAGASLIGLLAPDGSATTVNQIASALGAALVGFQQSGIDTVVRNILDKARERVSLEDFGAIGDFNPSTGTGTDDRAAIQAAIAHAQTLSGGAIIVSSPGKRYYLGTGYSDTTIKAQLVVGSRTTSNAANNITIETYGSEFYVGAAGFGIAVANANSCKWLGLRIFGYTGGTLGSSRENDAPVLINRNCVDITLQHHYITNSLGDCITISGAVDVASGGTGYTCRNIKILDGVLKSRYGNGTASVSGGTKSRNAISCIDVHGVLIRGNTIYGAIDLEPNISNQYIANVRITQNRFSTGHVTAQSSIGTAYWHDEPTALTGGSQLSNNVSLQGIAGAPLISGNVVEGNDFELTTIVGSYVYRWDRIADNTFQAGLIQLAADNVAGSMTNTQIARNIAYGVVGANTSFILLNGQVANCLFADNVLYKSGAYYCIKVGVNSVGPAFDQQNVFVNNLAIGGSGSITGATNANSLSAADSNTNGTRTITGNQTVNGTASCSTGSVSNSLTVGGNVAIAGSAVANRNIIFANNTAVATEFRNTNTGTGAGVAEFNAAAAQGTGFNLLDGYTSATGTPALQFFIRGDGTYGSRPNVYGATSDAKLKKDIALAGSQWNDVKALAAKVSKFRFKDDPDQVLMLGWIAQDVEAISPGMVDEHADIEWVDVLDEEGNAIGREKRPTGTTTKSVKYSIGYMKGFKALGEAMERIEALEAEMADLKARMA